MNEEKIIFQISKKIIYYYNNNILSDNLYSSWKQWWQIRWKNWNLVEQIAISIIEQIFFQFNIPKDKYNIQWKNDWRIKIMSQNWHINVSTDIHLSYNNHFILFIECKTYLDKCYLDRANSDMCSIKSKYSHSKKNSIIIRKCGFL